MADDERVVRLVVDPSGAEQGSRRAAKSLDDVQKAAGQTSSSTEDLEAKFRGLATAGGGVALMLTGPLTRGFKGIAGLARSATMWVVDFANLGLLTAASGLRQFADGMRDTEGELTTMGKVVDTTGAGLERLAGIMTHVSAIVFGLQVAAGLLATKLAVDLVQASQDASSEFISAWNRVRVTMGDSRDDFGELRGDVSALAGELGVEGPEAAATFYEILGSMPQLLSEPTKALEILTVSLEAGSTGFTESAKAAKATAAILTAFSMEADKAREVSDALFMAQGLGATTYGEIADSIGRVSGLASALGVEFTDLLGIVATLTPTGISTSEAITQVRSALNNIIKPSEKAKTAAADLGIEFSAAALEAKGLNTFLTDLISATDGQADVLAQLFGSDEALALLVALVDKTEDLHDLTNQITDSAGTQAEAVRIVNDSWERQHEIMDSKVSAALRGIGSDYEGLGVVGMETLNAMLQAWNDLDGAVRKIDPVAWGEAFRAGIAGVMDDIDNWFERMYGRPRVVTVTVGAVEEASELRRQAENQALIGMDRSALEFGSMLRRQQEINSADPIANPLPPLKTAAELAKEAAEEAKRMAEAITLAVETAGGLPGANVDRLGRDRRGPWNHTTGFQALSPNDMARANGSMDLSRKTAPGLPGLITPQEAGFDFEEFMDGAMGAAGGLAAVSDAFGVLDDSVNVGLRAVSDFARGMESIAEGKASGGIGGMLGMAGGAMAMVGAAVSLGQTLGGALFGDSPEEQRAREEQRRVINQNSNALRDLTLSIDGFRMTFGAMAKAEGVLTDANIARVESNDNYGTLWRQMGFSSVGELDAIAEHFGITWRNGTDVVDGALEQLRDALEATRMSVSTFGETLEGKTALTNARNEIFDITDPAKLLQSQFDLLAGQAPELFGDLSNLDLSSGSARNVLETRLRDLITEAMSGDLTAEDLAGFTSVDAFLEALTGADKALDGFADSMSTAATDIPKAINLALYRSRIGSGVTGGGGSTGGVIVDPVDSGYPIDGGGGGGGRGRGGGGSTTVVVENINVTNEAGDSPERMAEKMSRATELVAAQGGFTILHGVRLA